MQFYS